MQKNGILKKWDDEKGFGFIQSEGYGSIFLHISDVKRMPRRPRIGDVIIFDLIFDATGKRKAACAMIEGLNKIPVIYEKENKVSSSKFSLLFFLMLVVVCTSVVYSYFKKPVVLQKNEIIAPPVNHIKPIEKPDVGISTVTNVLSEPEKDVPVKQVIKPAYSCQGKHYCSQMNSCQEARFYLYNCPDMHVDGDNDGTPCEKEWCH